MNEETIESITFDSIASQITILMEDGTEKSYINKEEYLSDFPNRPADCIAMNWD